jgi:hypothetical protein
LRYAEDAGRLVADIRGGNFDGGDGAHHTDDEGTNNVKRSGSSKTRLCTS